MLIIFDMDGVLIDVSNSYREVTRLSVVRYMRDIIGVNTRDEGFVTLSDVADIKRSGCLNNDWDLTNAIINAYLGVLFDPYNQHLIHAAKKISRKGRDTEILYSIRGLLKDAERSVLEKALEEVSAKKIWIDFMNTQDSSINRGYMSPFLIVQGDVGEGNLSKRIFQELYLGRELFSSIYHETPIFYEGEGYIEKEGLIPDNSQLKLLSSLHTLSIATGRPRVEAEYALRRFGIEGFFSALVSEDDVVAAERSSGDSFRKPHPFSIEVCIERSCHRGDGGVYYIGDMPDDMIASRRAGAIPIGFVNEKASPEEERKRHRNLLIEKGAWRVFGNFEELISFLMEEQ
ncbi:MAG: HAD family hydrolase [Spirochaetota bacterium]